MQPLCTPNVSVNGSRWEGEAAAIRCKRWSCEVCAKINRRRVIAIACSAKPRALLTLTVSSKHYETPDLAAAALKRGLRLLRLHLKRHPKLSNFSFLAAFERHESGYPHLHLLIRGKFIPWKWLTSTWQKITGSTHVDIRKIDSVGKAAFYVSKYIGKELHAFANCKRWWRSHDYSEEADADYQDDKPHKQWTRYLLDYRTMYFNMNLVGFEVTRDGPDRLRWRWPPQAGEPPGWLWAASGGKSQ